MTTPGVEPAGVRSENSSSRTHEAGSRNEHDLRPAGAHLTSTPSQPQRTPVEERRARVLLQPHAWFPSALLCPSRPDKLSWLSWGCAGARQPQLSLPSRPTPPCRAGCEPRSCPWTEPGLSPRLSSVITKAAASCHVPQRRPKGPWGSHPRHPVPCRTLPGHSWRARL